MDRQTTAEALVSEYADDPEMARLVDLFVSELPRRVAALEDALAAGDTRRLQALAHQLKGAAPGYGFASIGGAAAGVESLIRGVVEPDARCVRSAVDHLTALCRRAA